MTFPIKELKNKKKQKDEDIAKQFVDAGSWQEFCIKIATIYGMNCNSIFSKWKLAYIALNRGKHYVYIPFILLGIITTTLFVFAGVFFNILQEKPTLFGITWLCLSIGFAIYMFIVKLFTFDNFIDNIEYKIKQDMYKY